MAKKLAEKAATPTQASAIVPPLKAPSAGKAAISALAHAVPVAGPAHAATVAVPAAGTPRTAPVKAPPAVKRKVVATINIYGQ